ncbi:MAG: SDR family NAD(P)-dependent oxidoreductase [Candidatus Dormibacteraceae bacterium]
MSGRFAGRVALVTGAARGQGAAAARLFCQEGASVVLVDLLDGEGARTAEVLRAEGHEARYEHLDVAAAGEWEGLVSGLERLDVLVNNAGITRAKGIARTSEAEWERVVGINQRGVWLGMRACLPLLVAGGHGAIVNVSSIYGRLGTASSTAYHASKGAVRALSKQAAVELAPRGIRVNCVLPGVIATPMLADIREDWLAGLMAHTPLGRPGEAEEVAHAVVFLASDQASYITGAELTVDGGYTAT